MRRWIIVGVAALSVCGCVAEPAPYYGGSSPYYGSVIAPGYVDISEGGGYYPYYSGRHIRSSYNNDYWHHQRGSGHWGGGARAGAAHAGGGHGDGGHH